jgi:von Willebrand factor A domain-containing protein 8
MRGGCRIRTRCEVMRRTTACDVKLTLFYSPPELINLVRHMRAYEDSLETSLRNVFDFDVCKAETMDVLYEVLEHHG